jgi:hypothetical protein
MSALSLSETALIPSSLVNCWGTASFKCTFNSLAMFLQTFHACCGLSVNSLAEHPLAISLCHSRFTLLFSGDDVHVIVGLGSIDCLVG